MEIDAGIGGLICSGEGDSRRKRNISTAGDLDLNAVRIELSPIEFGRSMKTENLMAQNVFSIGQCAGHFDCPKPMTCCTTVSNVFFGPVKSASRVIAILLKFHPNVAGLPLEAGASIGTGSDVCHDGAWMHRGPCSPIEGNATPSSDGSYNSRGIVTTRSTSDR